MFEAMLENATRHLRRRVTAHVLARGRCTSGLPHFTARSSALAEKLRSMGPRPAGAA